MLLKIRTDKAPTPGNYSQAVVYYTGNGYCFECAGQTGNIPDGKDEPVIEGGIGPQTTQTLKNLKAVIGACGEAVGKKAGLERITKVEVSMEDLKTNKSGFEQAYVQFFKDNGIEKDMLPPRQTIGVSSIPLPSEPTIVEISVRGYIPK